MARQRMKKWTSLLMIWSTIAGSVTLKEPVHAEEGSSRMQQYVEAMHPGWNLGNTFEALGDETAWGNPATTQKLVQAIADQGYRSIRIPITWNHRMGGAPDYTIDEKFVKRVKEVVDWALDAELYVMINLHHDSNWIGKMESDHDAVLLKFEAAWKQISDAFKDYPDKLMFESVNEPRFSENWSQDSPIYFDMLAELNDTFYGIVRKSGGNNTNRPLVLSTLTASPTQARLDELSKTIKKLDDPNVIATIHYYGYYPFSVNLGGSVSFDEAARKDLEQAFDRAYDTFVAQGIPVIVGEFGLLGFDKSVETIERGEVLKYLEYLTYYGQQNKFALMLWDNGQHFDRNALAWRNPDFYEAMNLGLHSRSSNAESDTVFVRRGEEGEDAAIRLNLNGNSLVEIRDGDRVLTAGADYALEGDRLTLQADLMKSLLKGGLGENAVLTCVFSAGADWKLHIVQYERPKLSSARGIRSSFDIPAQFNGDRLATMEAAYAAGGNAGPDEWTAYKEFGRSFKPNEEGTLIALTKEFFDQVRDGEVLLKLHYWSGEVVDYRLTIEGNNVSGVAAEEEIPAEASPVTDDAGSAPDASSKPASDPIQSEDTGKDEEPNAKAALVYIAGGIVAAAVAMAIAEAVRWWRRGQSR